MFMVYFHLCIYGERDIYCKELSHMIVRAGKSEICWACRESLDAALSSQTFLLGPSTDWMRPAYIMESNLLYSVY